MKLNSPHTRGEERRRPEEVKPWVSNQNPSLNPSQNDVLSLKTSRNLAKNSLGSKDMKEREALEAKMGEMKPAGAVLNSDPRRTGRPHGHRYNLCKKGEKNSNLILLL